MNRRITLVEGAHKDRYFTTVMWPNPLALLTTELRTDRATVVYNQQITNACAPWGARYQRPAIHRSCPEMCPGWAAGVDHAATTGRPCVLCPGWVAGVDHAAATRRPCGADGGGSTWHRGSGGSRPPLCDVAASHRVLLRLRSGGPHGYLQGDCSSSCIVCMLTAAFVIHLSADVISKPICQPLVLSLS